MRFLSILKKCGGNKRRHRFQSFYQSETFKSELKLLLASIADCHSLELARGQLLRYITSRERYAALSSSDDIPAEKTVLVRDCARALRSIFSARSEKLVGFSTVETLMDLANGRPRPDLAPGFLAELIHLVKGLEGRVEILPPYQFSAATALSGREAALRRSDQLDSLWLKQEAQMNRYPHGLADEVKKRRELRRAEILGKLNGSQQDWNDWGWQVKNIVTDPDLLHRLARLPAHAVEALKLARAAKLPFGVTPFYLSLMDDSGYDGALRAQVFPSREYVEAMRSERAAVGCSLDFMHERDTSPVELVTRRYPMIVILKPFNTCPQICVYCQRNWEIDQVMAPAAMASQEKIDQAISWIGDHPAIREVLITGGDPFGMKDDDLMRILSRVAEIDHIDRIRIGTRTIVTMPMRITESLTDMLANYRIPGRREVAVVTHVEHPYEINYDMLTAVERLRRAGISVYNQLVFTFYNSRRFEAAALRRLLKRVGIEPYYTFNTKGKSETKEFRVPIARLLQELKEEARLLPGLERTDSAVFNVPGLGKNYLRASQHRELLSILPDGSRAYEFHPWEKNIACQNTYICSDVPILDYLARLAEAGENVEDYRSIWYYF